MRKTIPFFLLFVVHNSYGMGGAEDKIADFMSWVVMLVLPAVGIYLFWQAHIYPEKVAEENNHPQLAAIKTLCLLSLFVGGLLWPIALVWANYKYPAKEVIIEHEEEADKKTEE